MTTEQRLKLAELCGLELVDPEDWQPATNIEQAVECLQAWLDADKYRICDIYFANFDRTWTVELETTKPIDTVGQANHNDKNIAITSAVLEALEGEEG